MCMKVDMMGSVIDCLMHIVPLKPINLSFWVEWLSEASRNNFSVLSVRYFFFFTSVCAVPIFVKIIIDQIFV